MHAPVDPAGLRRDNLQDLANQIAMMRQNQSDDRVIYTLMSWSETPLPNFRKLQNGILRRAVSLTGIVLVQAHESHLLRFGKVAPPSTCLTARKRFEEPRAPVAKQVLVKVPQPRQPRNPFGGNACTAPDRDLLLPLEEPMSGASN